MRELAGRLYFGLADQSDCRRIHGTPASSTTARKLYDRWKIAEPSTQCRWRNTGLFRQTGLNHILNACFPFFFCGCGTSFTRTVKYIVLIHTVLCYSVLISWARTGNMSSEMWCVWFWRPQSYIVKCLLWWEAFSLLMTHFSPHLCFIPQTNSKESYQTFSWRRPIS